MKFTGQAFWSGNHMVTPDCSICRVHNCEAPEEFGGLCERHLEEKLERQQAEKLENRKGK